MQEQDPLGDLPAAFFLPKCPSIVPAEMNNTPRCLALWKIINEEDAVLIPKSRGENFFSRFLHSKFFGVGVSRYAATPLVVALFPGHSDITRFRPWSSIATGNHLDPPKKFQNLLRRLAPLTILFRFQAFWAPLHGELPDVQIFMNDGPNPLT